ncbi:NAD(P)/FAD-dependent oxidoreductase [Nocardia sp. NBC_00508]|uniref:flavin-containing monooxygenase n=1 Tax=Nocardia sp. NBC_00508 TaxID=2975992 RepID=UPI002E82211B|nr:NAD(P)/FAD-dependent oxidoreductase [Nocardia sp. NBC_00508]WUD65288.1 NAD(P)/FAD-dependent oxidoreductase [Nocardia sp. NBC_00508]
MTSGNRIGIVGAGIAGLACAKVLKQEGFPVEVFDRAPDVGGVWSATRRYPGLRAQNSKDTYHFSDFPMPADYPRVLDGQQMQAYLAAYAEHFGLTEQLRLRTEVVAADPVDSGWLLEIRDESGVHRSSCDHLVIANGVFSEPAMPDYRGADWFRAAGGRLCHSSEFLDLESVRGKSVVVVGYGKSACDIATAVSEVAASTSVVARRLLWKMPRTLPRVIDYERLMLTRFGEAHFHYLRPGWTDRFLDGPGESVRISNFDLIQELATKRLRLRELGLVPSGRFEEIAESTISLATEGFSEQVANGRIVMHRDTTITEMGGGPKSTSAVRLSTGQVLQADVVICATGFHQRVPFLTPYVQRRLTDEHGNFRLHRQILPLEVPNLTFAGYNSSVISTVSAEVTAHWTAALLTGRLNLAPAETLEEQIDARLRWMEERTRGHHAHGTAVIPFSIQNIDEMLADLRFRLPLRTRAAQWFRRIKPESYRGLATRRKPGARPTLPPAAPIDAELLPYEGDTGRVSH